MPSPASSPSPLNSLSDTLVDAADRLAPGLLSLRAGRWRTTAFRFGEAGQWIAAAHALEGVDEATVTTAAGELRARIVGRDDAIDLAVLEADTGAGDLSWQDVALRPGQLLIGVSRPAEDLRVRLGQVVAVGGRSATPLGGRLETTVDLAWFGRNPLTTLLAEASGTPAGIAVGGRRGWVLTTAMIQHAVERIRRLGKVQRGYLGVLAQPVRLPAAMAPKRVGLMVTGIEEQSPAATAGVLLGDVLVGVAGTPIDALEDLWTALGPDTVGTKVELEVLRAGSAKTLEVQVGGRP